MYAHATSLDAFRKAGLAHAIPLFGSAVLGLAVERGRLTAAEAYELSRIDEAFQTERWGEDSEAARRTERGRAEAAAIPSCKSTSIRFEPVFRLAVTVGGPPRSEWRARGTLSLLAHSPLPTPSP